MLPQTHRIPLESAHKILATFGITRPTRAYERWVKDDGFDVRDFPDVLFESPYVFVLDWQAWLQEELERIVKTLALLQVALTLDLNEDGESGHVVCESRGVAVGSGTNESDGFDALFVALQSVMPPLIEFRGSPGNRDGDTFVYAVLPRDEWQDLEQVAPEVMAHFFLALNASKRDDRESPGP